jgi:hypothetical protein
MRILVWWVSMDGTNGLENSKEDNLLITRTNKRKK